MKSAFRIVGGLDFDASADRDDDKRALAEARKRARPLLREWLRRVRHHIRAGLLVPVDGLVAEELENYPSANYGRCYAGRNRIAEAIGSYPRTVDRSFQRLEACGLLQTRRGGPGKTATRFFCCNWRFVFGGNAFLPVRTVGHVASPDSPSVASLESPPVANKPSEKENPPEHNPPLSPDHALDGEIIDGAISFDEFWSASGKQGLEGFARSEWRKLDARDRAEIADRLRIDGRAIRRGVWSGTWLRDRLWIEKVSSEPEPELVVPAPRYVHAEVGSDLWRQEYERRRLAGESVKLMDTWAKEGRGITVKIERDAS